MHIERIVIQGFKTYKNTTVIDVISPLHNVVVGRNGSGKSNFFAAIRFVLSDAYTHMTREERQGLIHEGSGTVMSAYVEIIFDNSDRRFPIAKDRVSIRRTIGLKKDDYSLDGKSATRSDVMNLLESAGFSRSNPYYIVPQGRITALTNSKDSERLALLKEVSGAKVFEAKLKDSLKEMNNSNYKKLRIDETLASINERISDLQIESKDLEEYQELEKGKKVLEYKIFDREYADLNSQVERINEVYGDLLSESQQDLEELDKREKMCDELTASIANLKISSKVASSDKEQTEAEYNQLLNVKAEKSVKINEIRSNLTTSKENRESVLLSISHYESLIKEHKKKISKYTPELEKYRVHESKAKANLSEALLKQRALYSKQNRFLKFSTKKERDEWLQSQVRKISHEISSRDDELSNLESQASDKREEVFRINREIEQLVHDVNNDSNKSEIQQLTESINGLKNKMTELVDNRKMLWRDEIRLKSTHDSLTNDLTNANYHVNQTMDRAQAQGLNALKIITHRLQLSDSVLGPLADLFSVSDKYKTAVEVVAGNSLFHVVVDNDQTASLIMNELIRMKAGRVTFMPLNRLSPQEVEYPDSNEHHCIPIIKKLKYNDARVLPALKQVFGKTIVCSNLQKGSELARNFNINAITLDGDRAETKGVLSGGYRDLKNSRIDALKIQSKKKNELTAVQERLHQCVEEIESLNQQVTAVNNELHFKARELDAKKHAKEPQLAKISQLQDEKFNLEQDLNSTTTRLESLRTIKQNLTSTLNLHKQELVSKFAKSLTKEELEELKQLGDEVTKYENELDSVVTKLSDFESKVSKYESELTANYEPHLEKLRKEMSTPANTVDEYSLENLENELESLDIQLDTANSKHQRAIDEFENINKEIAKSSELLATAETQKLAILKKLESFSKTTEKDLSRKAILISRRDEVQKKIRELGVLPEEAFHGKTYDKLKLDKLLLKLNTINDKLKKFSHVNKKAMEQYHTFTKQRDEMTERREELEKSRESIEALIKSLETQKDEAITKSFKQVAKSFHDIFETLVPAGVAHLIMQKKKASSTDQDDDMAENDHSDDHGDDALDAENSENLSIDNYVGVSISASFNSKSDEQQRIEQFSGGQKSLCAIALILAIQKCDPAPFYLFDEIDANLDTQYRTAVASMINSLSRNAQFICTTFRPEMLQVADKFYGVMFNNKVSTVSEIGREEAMSFVEGQQNR